MVNRAGVEKRLRALLQFRAELLNQHGFARLNLEVYKTRAGQSNQLRASATYLSAVEQIDPEIARLRKLLKP